MRLPAVVIPVKSSGAKSRLSGVLNAAQRKEFSAILLSEVLEAVKGAGLGEECHVVSSDRDVLESAAAQGARPVSEDADAGVDEAVRRGMMASDAEEFLVLPSDLPLIGPSDLLRILELRRGGVGLVLTPSVAFDGTNALLFSRASRFPLSYDRNSFWNHLASASAMGLSVGVCTGPGVIFDVDSPADFRALVDSGHGGRAAAYARRALG